MLKKYKVYDFGVEIVAVDVERETDKIVWIAGRRHLKLSGWASFFDTWDEAKKMKIEWQLEKIKELKRKLNNAENELEDIKNIKKNR